MRKIKLFTTLTLLAVLVVLTGASCKKEQTNTNKKVTSDVEESGETVTMATKDAYGEDLADIERYPGSIRSYYAKDDYETDITYQTTDTEEKVREFYKNLLTTKGWKQTGTATDYIDFEKGNVDNPETVTVYFTPDEESGILEYEITYSPPLSEEELAEMNAEEE